MVGVALFCISMKVVFVLWLWRLEWKQQLYLGLLGDEAYTADIETALQVRYRKGWNHFSVTYCSVIPAIHHFELTNVNFGRMCVINTRSMHVN